LHPGKKAEKMLLQGRAAFLLTTIYDNSSDWREMRSPAFLLVEQEAKIHSNYTTNIALSRYTVRYCAVHEEFRPKLQRKSNTVR
jgi:hypothetical protein